MFKGRLNIRSVVATTVGGGGPSSGDQSQQVVNLVLNILYLFTVKQGQIRTKLITNYLIIMTI